MNTPRHFKQQLADELNARAAILSAPAPAGPRALLRLAPRRPMRLAMGVIAAAATVAVAWPLASGASGSHGSQQAAPKSQGTGGAGLDIVNADYAVKSQQGGKILIDLFSPRGLPGLQAVLRKAGIPAAVLTPSASCPTHIHGNRDNGKLREVMPSSHKLPDGSVVSVIDPSAIPKGDTMLFIAILDRGRMQGLGIALVRHVPSCISVV